MRKVIITGFIASLLLSACAPVVSHHGFVVENKDDLLIDKANDNKSTLLARLGNPSQIGVFDEEIWYYISTTQSRKAFYKDKTKERTITSIAFDDYDNIAEVKTYTLADGRVVDYNKSKTPTRGREVTILEQIFGSVGRAPVTLPGQDPNLPTAAGGPRTQ